jgi:hypothetical protein
VANWGSFDAPKCRITFTTGRDDNGDPILNQHGHSVAAEEWVAAGVFWMHFEQPGRRQQARNLDRMLDDN